jgi:hypothetical protein
MVVTFFLGLYSRGLGIGLFRCSSNAGVSGEGFNGIARNTSEFPSLCMYLYSRFFIVCCPIIGRASVTKSHV